MNKYLKIFLWIVGGFAASLMLSVLYYTIFALLVSTDVEKALKEENRLYEKYLPQIQENAELMERELAYLQGRDEAVYRAVFKAEAPDVNRMIAAGLELEDIKGRIDVVKRAHIQSLRTAESARGIEECWKEVFDSLASKAYARPPLVSPIGDLQFSNVGASVGDKLSPFYKMTVRHDGLDIVAPAGTPVLATADGRVTNVQKSSGGKGNMVEITHAGGYVTRYAHLSTVKAVKGRSVKAGDVIGGVGDSGRSFTTHLHYEILKDGATCDPNHYLYCSVNPEEYLRILIKSAASGQSMD